MFGRIRGHDGPREPVKGSWRGFKRFCQPRRSFQNALDGQRHADHSRRADHHLFHAATQYFRDEPRGGPRSSHPARANRAICISGIDDDGAHRVRRRPHMGAGKNHRRRLHEILREHSRSRRGRIGDNQRDVERAGVAALFEACGRSGKTKSARQRPGGWEIVHFFQSPCRISNPAVARVPDRVGIHRPNFRPEVFLNLRKALVLVRPERATTPRAHFPRRSGQSARRVRDTRQPRWQPVCSDVPWDR